MKKICKNKDSCGTVMPTEKNKILKFNEYMESDKMPYIIQAALESLIKKQMDMKIIPKVLQQQKQVSIFLVNFQSQQFGDLIIKKTSILYIVEKIV